MPSQTFHAPPDHKHNISHFHFIQKYTTVTLDFPFPYYSCIFSHPHLVAGLLEQITSP